ncbi:Kanadaptin [Apophysomyces ossiformis]|uniref:Kanadaptin n=1 Tax=Apophysomyces ossiformis TaxID=679940 RepID=A0A8H7BTJ9_9FUNG|nr:Kanadaptin [Apophysomyces ossiformis]
MAENKDDKPFAVPAPRPARKQDESENTEQIAPTFAYSKPTWAGVASFDYGFEVLKGGITIENIKCPKKDHITIGRLPLCDVQMEHPVGLISRLAAQCVTFEPLVDLSFNEDGDAFLYDLNSAHGTKINKRPVPPREHIPLRAGDQLRFGESTRLYIFETEKPESEEQLIQEEETARQHRSVRAARQAAKAQQAEENDGITWGFREDAVEEDEEDNKEGLSEEAMILNAAAERMAAEDAKRRREDLEIMFGGSDSDEDTYYDRSKRKKAKKQEKAETHDQLLAKKQKAEARMQALQREIERREKEGNDASCVRIIVSYVLTDAEAKKSAQAEVEEEDLDAYMNKLDKVPENKVSVYSLKKELQQLKKVR